jgi:peptidoglycan/LPS O-acetylase OafA/YrhL
MGTLRLFLALSVLNNHFQFAGHGPWMYGPTAVAAFFIISGFYISMVLDQTYHGVHVLWRFYANRFLRLMPVYWATLLIIVIATKSGNLGSSSMFDPVHSIINSSSDLNWHGRIAGIATNLLLFPDSIFTMFSGLHTGSAWEALVSGQMYTVGLEIMFYAIAPFLVMLNGRGLIVVLLAAATVHFAPLWDVVNFAPFRLDLKWRPWQYEFFPSILVFFLLGRAGYMLSQKDFSKHIPAWLARKKSGWIALLIILGICTWFNVELRSYTNTWQTWFFYISLAFLIPWLFLASSRTKWDRFLGDLSYPLYVCHFLVIAWLTHLGWTSVWIVFVGVILASVILRLSIDLPIERWRDTLRHAPNNK